MLGLGLMALLALSAIFAGSAFAKKAKNPYEKFIECPRGAEITGCIFGEAGKESYFQAGKVTIPFKKPIDLQLGFYGEGEVFPVVAARNGQSIVKEAEPARV